MIWRKTVLSILFCFLVFRAIGQDFSRFFLDTADQQTANGILLESSGKIWMGGTKLPAGADDLRAWLYRLNENGEVLQRFSFPFLGSQTWVGMAWAGEGKMGVVIGQRLLSGITENWMALLDTTGILSFQKLVGADQAILDHVSGDGQGHFYMCGFKGTTGQAGNDMWIGKVKAPGQLVWTFEEDYSPNDHAAQSRLGPGNRLYVAGTVQNQGYNPFAACLDTSGNLVWDLIISTVWNDGGRALDFDSQGRMWMVGESSTWLGPEFDTEISIISTSGQLQWLQWLGAPGQEAAFAIQKASGTGIWVGGYSNATTGFTGPVSPFLMRMDEGGNSLGEAFWPQTAPSPVYDLKVVRDSLFYFCGISNDRAFLFKRIQPALSNVFVVSNQERDLPEMGIGYFFKPESRELVWMNKKEKPVKVELRDALGRMIWTVNQPQERVKIPVFGSGMYLLKTWTEKNGRPQLMRILNL